MPSGLAFACLHFDRPTRPTDRCLAEIPRYDHVRKRSKSTAAAGGSSESPLGRYRAKGHLKVPIAKGAEASDSLAFPPGRALPVH